MKRKYRVFIAINLPEDVKKELVGYQKKWSDLPARWVSRDNLHITLVFLGYLTDVELGEVCMIVKEVAQKYNSFDINLNKVIYGPVGKNPPRMIWVEVERLKELSFLKKDLEGELLNPIGFRPEARTFNLHITLARIKLLEFRSINPEERPEVNEDLNLNFSVESIEVMESQLKRPGTVYTIMESFSLK